MRANSAVISKLPALPGKQLSIGDTKRAHKTRSSRSSSDVYNDMYSATLISLNKAAHYEFETVLDLPVAFNAAECPEVIIEQFIARYFATSCKSRGC